MQEGRGLGFTCLIYCPWKAFKSTRTYTVLDANKRRKREASDLNYMDFLEESGFCPSTGIYYSKWDSPTLPLSPSLSLPSFLLSFTPQVPSKPAFIDARTGHTLTYGELGVLAEAVAMSLHSRGIKKGDVVLLVSPNSLHFPLLVLGIMYVGAIFSAANPLNTREEIQAQAQDSKVALIITTKDLQPKLAGLIYGPLVLVEALLQGLAQGLDNCAFGLPRVAQSDTATLMYSSGTTGKSKAVVGSHKNLIAMSCLLRHAWSADGPGCDEVYMCLVPLFHMFGLSVFVCGVLAFGSTAVILAKYSFEEMVMAIEEFGVTRLPAVPPIVIHLSRADKVAKTYSLGTLKEVICSGAPLGRKHMERFSLCYPQVILSQCYGLTETNGPVTLCNGISGRCHVSIGRQMPCMEAKIVDIHTGNPLPPGKYGELCIRGPPLTQGYLGNKEATPQAIDVDGWLYTGDLCFIDTRGLIYLVDRIKELIKYKGYQVAPAELEEILITHPQILEAAVIPYPNEEAGEIPMACVVKASDGKLKEEDVVNFTADKVAPYKKIRKVMFVDSIPRSASGKILRRHLKVSNTRPQLEITPRL